jgi:putative nucleotidyltransferase with HDIG domain
MTPLSPIRLERLRDKMFRRVPALRIRSERAALAFVNSVGCCSTFYRFPEGLPCLWEAVAGRRDPRWPRRSHHDPGIGLTWELKDVLPTTRHVYYGQLLQGRPVLVALDLFPCFYALVRGRQRARHYRVEYEAGRLSLTAKRIMDAMVREHPQYTRELRAASFMLEPAKTREFERAMAELQQALWLVKVEERYEPTFSYRWDLPEAWLPELVSQGRRLQRRRAAETLLASYTRSAVFTTVPLMARLFGLSREEVGEAVGALVRRGALVPDCPVAGWPGRWLVHSSAVGSLSKLERLKQGRPPIAPPRARRSAERGAVPQRAAPLPLTLSLAQFPSPCRAALTTLTDLLGHSRDGFLVGGAIRDLLLSREPIDELDVALPSGALEMGRRLAQRSGGAFVTLDRERGAARVVLGAATGLRQIDLTDFRADSLEGDLRRRDFTVNAIAVSLRALAHGGRAPLVDPTDGRQDLARRRLRAAGPGALEDDPLRALRGVRLAFLLRFTLTPQLRSALRKSAPRLSEVAAERIREELTALLVLPHAGQGLRELDRLGLLGAVLPEVAPMKTVAQPRPHRFTVWEHSLRAVESGEALFSNLSALEPYATELAAHLAEPVGDGLTRRELLKLALLLHDVAKPQTRAVIRERVRFIGHDVIGASISRSIGQRLRLAGSVVVVLERLVRHHLRPMHLAQLPTVSRRARYRFFRDLEREAQDLLLLSLADAAAVRGVSPLDVWRGPFGRLVADLLGGWQEDQRLAGAPPLLRGEDVMGAFHLPPGPEVGRLLALAREARALGKVRTGEQALDYLRDRTQRIDQGGSRA